MVSIKGTLSTNSVLGWKAVRSCLKNMNSSYFLWSLSLGGPMKKIVKIGNTEYSMKSSAYTQFKYKNDTGRKMLEDLQSLTKLQNATEEEALVSVDDIVEIVLRMAFIMIEEADAKQITTYDEFLKSIDGLFDDTEWINQVIELATSPISRGV